MRSLLAFLLLIALVLPAHAKPNRHQAWGFSYVVPQGWTLVRQPTFGKAPKETRRWELTRPATGGPATISLEADRSENLGRFPVAAGKFQAENIARTFGFTGYFITDLQVKGVPGFYEYWTADLPGRRPFRIVAATLYRAGIRYGLTAQVPIGASTGPVESELRAMLKTWRWEPLPKPKWTRPTQGVPR